MITNPTVLILGAGASIPYGFPSGLKLRNQIIDLMDVPKGSYKHDNIQGHLKTLKKIGFELDLIKRFRKAFHQSQQNSIDAFLNYAEEFREIANNGIKGFGVMERSMAFSLSGGATVVDLKSAFYDLDDRPYVVPFVAGVGGRDVTVDNQCDCLKKVLKVAENKERDLNTQYVNFHGRYQDVI